MNVYIPKLDNDTQSGDPAADAWAAYRERVAWIVIAGLLYDPANQNVKGKDIRERSFSITDAILRLDRPAPPTTGGEG